MPSFRDRIRSLVIHKAMLHCGVSFVYAWNALTKLTDSYQAIRQTVKIVSMENRHFLRTGDRCSVEFEFVSHPEFIRTDMKLLFREGKTKVRSPIFSTLAFIHNLSHEGPWYHQKAITRRRITCISYAWSIRLRLAIAETCDSS